MSVSGLQGAGYSAARYPVGSASPQNIRSAFGQSGMFEKSLSASNGNYHGTLKMGYLHSGFSPVSGRNFT